MPGDVNAFPRVVLTRELLVRAQGLSCGGTVHLITLVIAVMVSIALPAVRDAALLILTHELSS